MRFELNAPHSPLSAVTSTKAVGPVFRAASNGCVSSGGNPATASATSASISCMRSANGRAARMRSCAFFMRAAAIIFMAFVIC